MHRSVVRSPGLAGVEPGSNRSCFPVTVLSWQVAPGPPLEARGYRLSGLAPRERACPRAGLTSCPRLLTDAAAVSAAWARRRCRCATRRFPSSVTRHSESLLDCLSPAGACRVDHPSAPCQAAGVDGTNYQVSHTEPVKGHVRHHGWRDRGHALAVPVASDSAWPGGADLQPTQDRPITCP